MDWSDLERATRTVFDRHLVNGEVSDMQLRAFQEAVEAAGYRAFNSRLSHEDRPTGAHGGRGLLQRLARRHAHCRILLPSSGIPLRYQWGWWPSAFWLATMTTKNKSIFEPTAGNGGLLTLVKNHARVFAIELDGKRANVQKGTSCEKVVVGDAVELGTPASHGATRRV